MLVGGIVAVAVLIWYLIRKFRKRNPPNQMMPSYFKKMMHEKKHIEGGAGMPFARPTVPAASSPLQQALPQSVASPDFNPSLPLNLQVSGWNEASGAVPVVTSGPVISYSNPPLPGTPQAGNALALGATSATTLDSDLYANPEIGKGGWQQLSSLMPASWTTTGSGESCADDWAKYTPTAEGFKRYISSSDVARQPVDDRTTTGRHLGVRNLLRADAPTYVTDSSVFAMDSEFRQDAIRQTMGRFAMNSADGFA